MWEVLTNEELLKSYRTAVMKKLDALFIQLLLDEILRRNLHEHLDSTLDIINKVDMNTSAT